MSLLSLSRLLTAALLLIPLAVLPARGEDYRIAPPPSWVETLAPQPGGGHPVSEVSGGVDYLLIDSQTRVEGSTAERYFHSVTKVVNRQGIESAAGVAIEFDPSYEAVTLHRVVVRRGKEAVDQLAAERISVLQRERELEALIYDGTRTLNLILDDVRVGDLVDVSYTVRGLNPVFGGRYFDGVELQWSVPVAHLSWRLLWPAGRPLQMKNHRTDLAPALRTLDGWQEYRWEEDAIPALIEDEQLPEWYDPYPWVQLGETGSWREVVDWALPLYRVPRPLSPLLRQRIAEIAASSPDPEERIRTTLRFVQDEIRYLGIEIGPGSHAPNDPSLVLQRRFGDCKDKALLAATILVELGIDAAPALVDTQLREHIAELLPSPTVFNHVILHVRLGDRTLWLDPTLSEQRGSLASLTQSEYGLALVLEPGGSALSAMPPADPATVLRSVAETFDLRRGVGETAQLQVVSIYRGAEADEMRARLAASSRGELAKAYLEFYSATYPTLVAAAPLETQDDEADNRLTVTERYTVPDLWERNDEEGRWEANFYPLEIADYLETPTGLRRHMPLALPFPASCRLTTEVLLPGEWDIEGEAEKISDPLFHFDRTVACAGNRLTLSYRFESRGDHLPPESLGSYVKKLQQAREALGYRIYRLDAAPATLLGSGRGAVLLVLALVLALRRWRPGAFSFLGKVGR